jgi:hypothetical protein
MSRGWLSLRMGWVKQMGGCRPNFVRHCPVVPVAVTLVWEVKRAVLQIESVTEQNCEIVGYIQAEELTALIKQTVAQRSSMSVDSTYIFSQNYIDDKHRYPLS